MTTEELNALIAQAEGGDVAAMNQLGQIYGGNEFKDLEKAFYWIKKSAETGDVLGMSNLGGWCYLWGNGTEKNLKLAVDWLGKASEQGNIWSMIRLSCDIYCQDNEYKDYTKAFSILEKVFERYFELNDTDKDYALKFVEEIAETGNVQAMLLSKEHSWDPQKQEYWTKKAAEAGDAKSQFIKAGDALYNNDIDIAIDLFIKSAKGGNADAAARLNELGAEFQFGNNGRTINLPLAYKFYEASADCGNADGMANAAYCLSNGIGVEKDLKKCFELYSKAAELGNQFGYSNLGWCYMYGNGTEKNIPEAIKWLAKAADEFGNVWSMNRLTDIYGTFDGFINHEQAAKWFLELIKRDCDPNSGVYEKTGYNKDLYEKVKNTILNSSSENDMSSLLGSSSGGSLLGNSIYFTSSNAKSYINQAEEAIKQKIAYKEEEARKKAEEARRKAEEEARKRAEEEKARREAEEQARREREEKERQERERREREEKKKRAQAFIIKVQKDYEDYDRDIEEIPCEWEEDEMELIIDKNIVVYDFNAFNKVYKRTLIIPESVSHIGNNVFVLCWCFNAVHLPNSLTSIGKRAFQATGLAGDLIIPHGVSSIGESAFEGNDIASITIPDSVTYVGKDAFADLKYLKTIEFPNGVVEIVRQGSGFGSYIRKILVPKAVKQRFLNIFGDYCVYDLNKGRIKWSSLIEEK